jgi:hypothetical protein
VKIVDIIPILLLCGDRHLDMCSVQTPQQVPVREIILDRMTGTIDSLITLCSSQMSSHLPTMGLDLIPEEEMEVAAV